MKKKVVFGALCSFGFAAAAATATMADVRDVQLRGHVGERFGKMLANHVVASDPVHYAEAFRNKNETWAWQTEFWGKYMHTAAPFSRIVTNPELKAKMAASLEEMLANQLPDGYLGNYREGLRYDKGWDVWGTKYTLLGFLHYHDHLGDKRALDAAEKLAGRLMAEFGPGKRDLCKTGGYCGMPSCSVLEPIVWLYKRTGKKAYLDFAKYVREQMDLEDGPRLIKDAKVPVFDRRKPDGNAMKSVLKAYEMMSCYQGLVEYWEVTGERACLDAAVATAESIAKTEINLAGGAAHHEHWFAGASRQDKPYARQQETCVLTTWMRLCQKLHAVTGDAKWLDEFEKTFYNAYLGSLKPDGSVFAMYTPLNGTRAKGEYHCRMHTNCCTANGPRGYLAFLESFLTARGDAAEVNFYASATAQVKLPKSGREVRLETFTLYPSENHVRIWNRSAMAGSYTIAFRIPAWSAKTQYCVNGEPAKDAQPDAAGYLRLAREWKPGDLVELFFDLSGRAHRVGDSVAFTRGPIALARDLRFGAADLAEPLQIGFDVSAPVPMTLLAAEHEGMWMEVGVTLPMGLHSESPEHRRPKMVKFCDFSSAGNTWQPDSAYRLWLPIELDTTW